MFEILEILEIFEIFEILKFFEAMLRLSNANAKQC